jgi:hypothetical protein
MTSVIIFILFVIKKHDQKMPLRFENIITAYIMLDH